MQAHPICYWNHHALPRELWDEPSTPCILIVAFDERRGVFIENLTTSNASTQYDMLTSPTMITASPVRGQGPPKVRLRGNHNRFKDLLLLKFVNKASNGVIYFRELIFQLVLEVAVHVPTP